MNTKIFLPLLLCSMTVLPLRVAADPPMGHVPPGQVYRSLESGMEARPAGTVHGAIESIDYASGTVVVRAGNRIAVVAIVPSTSIYGRDGMSGLSDMRRGQNVEISVYEVGGRLVAQSVRIK